MKMGQRFSSSAAPGISPAFGVRSRAKVPHDADVILNDEHDAFKWVSFEEAEAMLSFPGQRKALAAVKAEFVDSEPNLHLKIDIDA